MGMGDVEKTNDGKGAIDSIKVDGPLRCPVRLSICLDQPSPNTIDDCGSIYSPIINRKTQKRPKKSMSSSTCFDALQAPDLQPWVSSS